MAAARTGTAMRGVHRRCNTSSLRFKQHGLNKGAFKATRASRRTTRATPAAPASRSRYRGSSPSSPGGSGSAASSETPSRNARRFVSPTAACAASRRAFESPRSPPGATSTPLVEPAPRFPATTRTRPRTSLPGTWGGGGKISRSSLGVSTAPNRSRRSCAASPLRRFAAEARESGAYLFQPETLGGVRCSLGGRRAGSGCRFRE